MQTSVGAYAESWLEVQPGLSLYVREYGVDRTRTPVVCLHGYWRTLRDFEELAQHLAPMRRVITVDLRGRGRSGRSENADDYRFECLSDDLLKLLEATQVHEAVFVGLALGAQLSWTLAASERGRVAGLVLNDSGPEANPAAGQRMKGFAGADAVDAEEAMRRVRAQYAVDFPLLDEAKLRRIVYRNYAPGTDGLYVRDFDQLTNREIARMKTAHPNFWPEFNATAAIPTVILRGANSDYLTNDVVRRMLTANPSAKLCIVPDVGHPIMLWEPEALAAIDALLADIDAGG